VRLAPGVEALELRDLADALQRTGLARQKWPEELRIVDDFPRTASGKIRKVDLRRDLRTTGVDSVRSGNEIDAGSDRARR
jgi:non-ribosomal peptide synthetase component E (peptide arylation enzyme)